MENGRWDKFRLLTMSLIFSGALNVGLILALVISSVEESNIPAPLTKAAPQGGVAPANRQLLSEMVKLSFAELIVYLTNRDSVEEGYMKRDLALSALTASHFFNIEKALSGPLPQRRTVSLSSKQNVEMYPGLSDEQYEAIIRFAYQEKWPLTAVGLFHNLKKCPRNARDESLGSAFLSTPEFYALQVLFQKTEAAQDPLLLIDLICEGPWQALERFAEEQSKALDLSVDKRRSLLLNYISYRSSVAASLLLKTDFAFAKSRLADGGVLALLELLNEPNDAAKRFCVEMLHSPRTDAVRRMAAEKLYKLTGENIAAPLEVETAVERFPQGAVPKSTPVQNPPIALAPKKQLPPRLREHIVQDGESLWKISRQYKVKVDDLIEVNALEKDRLVPGMVLKIPQGGALP